MKSKLGFFVHPVPMAAVILMAVNDHLLKYSYSGWFTGKLSDFCGIFYLPIFILAIQVAICSVLNFQRLNIFIVSRTNLLLSIVFTDLLLIAVKLSPAFARSVESFFSSHLFRIQMVQDPTDLLALLVNPLTYYFVLRRWAELEGKLTT